MHGNNTTTTLWPSLHPQAFQKCCCACATRRVASIFAALYAPTLALPTGNLGAWHQSVDGLWFSLSQCAPERIIKLPIPQTFLECNWYKPSLSSPGPTISPFSTLVYEQGTCTGNTPQIDPRPFDVLAQHAATRSQEYKMQATTSRRIQQGTEPNRKSHTGAPTGKDSRLHPMQRMGHTAWWRDVRERWALEHTHYSSLHSTWNQRLVFAEVQEQIDRLTTPVAKQRKNTLGRRFPRMFLGHTVVPLQPQDWVACIVLPLVSSFSARHHVCNMHAKSFRRLPFNVLLHAPKRMEPHHIHQKGQHFDATTMTKVTPKQTPTIRIDLGSLHDAIPLWKRLVIAGLLDSRLHGFHSRSTRSSYLLATGELHADAGKSATLFVPYSCDSFIFICLSLKSFLFRKSKMIVPEFRIVI